MRGLFTFYSHTQPRIKPAKIPGVARLHGRNLRKIILSKWQVCRKTCQNVQNFSLQPRPRLYTFHSKLWKTFPKREIFHQIKTSNLKKNEKILLYGGLAAFGILLFSKVRALGNLVINPGNVVSMGFANAVPVAEFTIVVQNTSSASITINSFAGNVFSNQTLIGNVYNFQPVYIPGNSQTPISVYVEFKALGIVNDLIRSFQYNNFSQQLQVSGFANVLGIQLPVNLNFSVGQNGPL